MNWNANITRVTENILVYLSGSLLLIWELVQIGDLILSFFDNFYQVILQIVLA